MRSMTHHPQLHERITTVSALFPGSRVELLVLDEGTAMVTAIHGTCHCSVLLDDGGRRSIITTLGGIPRDSAQTMVKELEAELRAEREAELEAEARARGARPVVSTTTGLERDPVELARVLRRAADKLGGGPEEARYLSDIDAVANTLEAWAGH